MTKTTVKLPGLSGKEWIKKLEKKDVGISSYAKDLLFSDKFQGKKEDVEYAIVSVQDLGFDSYPTTTELFARTKERGYDLCPPEIGPVLAQDYEEKGSWMYIAMEPIAGSGGSPGVFRVERDDDGRRWLDANWANPDVSWDLDGRIVFRLRKSSDLESKNLPSESRPFELPDQLTINGTIYDRRK